MNSNSNKESKTKPVADEPVSSEKKAVKSDGVYVYIGPSLRGVIQNGSIYRGASKPDVLKKIATAVEKYPRIANLIVRDSELAVAKEKIKNGGNSMSISYKALLSAE